MLRDPLLLVNIQLAIVGIVTVAGLFYLWRMICRVERKVNDVIRTLPQAQPAPQAVDFKHVQPEDEELDEETDAFMKEVFGGATPMFIMPSSLTPNTGVHIEEEPVTEAPVPQEEAHSEAETHSVHLSKNKLKRMSLEALRDLCKDKGLSQDGTKAALMDRILATVDEAEE
jgi:hypothetical protein